MGHEGASASIRWQIQIYKTLDVGKSIAYEEERERRRRGCALKTWYVSTTFVDLDLSEFRQSDIRTYYVFFILSFIDPETSSLVKSTFLEQQRDIFLSIFKGLSQDSYLVIRKVLEVCWVGLWSDPKVKRTAKIGLFSEITIGHVSDT
jgi:hypothetical protein